MAPENEAPGNEAPGNEYDVREAPGYRHVRDRTALCSVLTRGTWRPAEPVEGDPAEAAL